MSARLLGQPRTVLLKVIEKDAAPRVELKHNQMLLQTRPATSEEKKEAILDEWYRAFIKSSHRKASVTVVSGGAAPDDPSP